MFRIRGSIGFGIFLLVLLVMMPAVFSGLESMLSALLNTLTVIAEKGGEAAETADFSSGTIFVPSVN